MKRILSLISILLTSALSGGTGGSGVTNPLTNIETEARAKAIAGSSLYQ
tara:strand:- start:541 stop:687 length:147 start_codon:yes stop_codon:yes gene_type:complete